MIEPNIASEKRTARLNSSFLTFSIERTHLIFATQSELNNPLVTPYVNVASQCSVQILPQGFIGHFRIITGSGVDLVGRHIAGHITHLTIDVVVPRSVRKGTKLHA